MPAKIKRAAESLWYLRSRTWWLNFPLPWRLPYGGWFLAYGDTVGAGVAGYRLANHPYEEGEWKFLQRTLRPGDTVVDVGANQGFFTILASRCVGATGTVYAFEPAPRERVRLARNLRINRCHNVVVESFAVSAQSGSATLNVYGWHQGSLSSLRPAAEDVTAPSTGLEVDTVSLDDWAAARGIQDVRVIKIDCEGGELDVLRGGHELMSRRPVIMCETEQRRASPWGHTTDDLLREGSQAGYTWYRVNRNGDLVAHEPGGEVAPNMVAVPAGGP